MKKIVAFFVLLMGVLCVYSQISLNRTDFFEVGNEIPQIKYYSNSEVGVPFSTLFGEELIFDDLDWTNFTIDTLRFFNPQETDPENVFAEANCSQITEDGFVLHYSITESSIVLVGVQAQQPMTGDIMNMLMEQNVEVYSFPIALNDNNDANAISAFKEHISVYESILPPDYYGYLTALFDSVKFEIKLSFISEFDEFGSMEMKGLNNLQGTFDYLREKRTDVTYVNVYLRNKFSGSYTPVGDVVGDQLPVELPMIDSAFTYSYWTKGHNYPLVELIMTNDFQNVKQANYRHAENEEEIGNSELFSSVKHSVFPNPVTEMAVIKFDNLAGGNVYIFSQTGKLIEQLSFEGNSTTINTASFAVGMYFYQLIDRNGQIIGKGKFIKQ